MNFLPRVRIAIDGIMPGRALLRFKRAGICLYNIQKPQKNRILFSVKKKDCEKVSRNSRTCGKISNILIYMQLDFEKRRKY